jgi:transcriptional regulator of arginine metabolism
VPPVTDKPRRQFAIKEILHAGATANQEDLRRHLARRGFKTTQATLSRDLKELGVARFMDRGRLRYTFPDASEASALKPIVGAEIRAIDFNEGLIVIHTLPGAAHTVGEYIDVQNHRDIIGTVAGDNTLLVVPRSHSLVRAVVKFLKHKLIEGKT